ncbi:MAG: M14 family zinc carboxypeptidase, partial [Bacteroidales bacterium]
MKRNLLVLISLMMLFACKSPGKKDLLESEFFKDPGIVFNTPSFQKDSGFVNYLEMIEFLNSTLMDHSDLARVEYLDASEEGNPIPVVYFSNNTEGDKLKVWFQGGLHGNEPAGTEGLLDLIDNLANNETYQNYLTRMDIAILPMANIDGFNKQRRRNSNNRDLNRDQTKLYESDSRILKSAFSAFSPDIAFDCHEFNPDKNDFRNLGKEGCTLSYDVLFLTTGNLNVPAVLRSVATELFVKEAQQVFDSKGISYHEYFSPSKTEEKVFLKQGASNPRSSVSSYSLSNAVSVLLEIRGIGIGRTNFNRRVYSYRLAINSFLKTAFDNSDSIKNAVGEA